MKVILFGSIFNPLSAEAAIFFKERKMLEAIVIPTRLPINFCGGIVYFISLLCIAFYRYLHVLLRWLRFKRSENYLSLLEFIKDNPDIAVYLVGPQEAALGKLAYFKNTKPAVGFKEYVLVSCIFPFKISSGLFPVEKLINIHPGILPQNRGPNPYFWALANKMKSSGITCHRLTTQIDAGPILYQEVFPINFRFSEYKHEKVSIGHLRHTLQILFNRFDEFWLEAKPQGVGTYYPMPSFRDRKQYARFSIFQSQDILLFLKDLVRH